MNVSFSTDDGGIHVPEVDQLIENLYMKKKKSKKQKHDIDLDNILEENEQKSDGVQPKCKLYSIGLGSDSSDLITESKKKKKKKLKSNNEDFTHLSGENNVLSCKLNPIGPGSDSSDLITKPKKKKKKKHKSNNHDNEDFTHLSGESNNDQGISVPFASNLEHSHMDKLPKQNVKKKKSEKQKLYDVNPRNISENDDLEQEPGDMHSNEESSAYEISRVKHKKRKKKQRNSSENDDLEQEPGDMHSNEESSAYEISRVKHKKRKKKQRNSSENDDLEQESCAMNSNEECSANEISQVKHKKRKKKQRNDDNDITRSSEENENNPRQDSQLTSIRDYSDSCHADNQRSPKKQKKHKKDSVNMIDQLEKDIEHDHVRQIQESAFREEVKDHRQGSAEKISPKKSASDSVTADKSTLDGNHVAIENYSQENENDSFSENDLSDISQEVPFQNKISSDNTKRKKSSGLSVDSNAGDNLSMSAESSSQNEYRCSDEDMFASDDEDEEEKMPRKGVKNKARKEEDIDVAFDDPSHRYSLAYLREKGLNLNTERWSKKEDTLLLKNWEDYLKKYPVAGNPYELINPREVSALRKQKELKKIRKDTKLFTFLGEGLCRPAYNVYLRARIILKPNCSSIKEKPLTEEENETLMTLFEEHGPKWTEIGRQMGRNPRSLAHIVKSRIEKEKFQKGAWTKEEENQLKQAIHDLVGPHKGITHQTRVMPWSDIAKQVRTRSSNQCKAKWLHWKTEDTKTYDYYHYAEEQKEIILAINNTHPTDEKDIDWQRIHKDLPNTPSPQYLQNHFRWMMSQKVPFYKDKPFSEAFNYLVKDYIPRLNERITQLRSTNSKSTKKNKLEHILRLRRNMEKGKQQSQTTTLNGEENS